MSTQQLLINSYLEAGYTYGFDNVTLAIIAGMTNIQKPSIYAHYKNYENLKLAAVKFCTSELDQKDFSVEFKAPDFQTMLNNFFNKLIDTFSVFPLNCYVSLLEQKKTVDSQVATLNSSLNSMLRARVLVALDYAVQRSWLDISDTDACAEILTPYLRYCINFSISGNLTNWENIFSFLKEFR